MVGHAKPTEGGGKERQIKKIQIEREGEPTRERHSPTHIDTCSLRWGGAVAQNFVVVEHHEIVMVEHHCSLSGSANKLGVSVVRGTVCVCVCAMPGSKGCYLYNSRLCVQCLALRDVTSIIHGCMVDCVADLLALL